jgi:hypothetical protein
MEEIEMPDTDTFYTRVVRQSVESVRPNSLRRLLAVNHLIEWECAEYHGPAFERFLDQREPQIEDSGVRAFVLAMDSPTYYLLEEGAAELLSDDEVSFLFDISERTARDYVAALRNFYLW